MWRDPYFLNFPLFLVAAGQAEHWPHPPIKLRRGRKHAAFKSEVASDCFWNVLVYLEAARLAIHALDCMDKSFPYTDRLR